jgi:hypothetical protein
MYQTSKTQKLPSGICSDIQNLFPTPKNKNRPMLEETYLHWDEGIPLTYTPIYQLESCIPVALAMAVCMPNHGNKSGRRTLVLPDRERPRRMVEPE